MPRNSFPIPASFTAPRAELHRGRNSLSMGCFPLSSHIPSYFGFKSVEGHLAETLQSPRNEQCNGPMSPGSPCVPITKLAALQWQPCLDCLLLFLQLLIAGHCETKAIKEGDKKEGLGVLVGVPFAGRAQKKRDCLQPLQSVQ